SIQERREDTYPFLNSLFEDGRSDGLYAQPFAFSPVILCYNKEHFTEKGVFEPDSSWTWHDFWEQVGKLPSENRFGFFFNLASLNRWILFFLQNGAEFGT